MLSSWVLSIVGVVVLSVVVEMIIPNGKTAKTIKGVMAFITVLIIASPLTILFDETIDVFDYSVEIEDSLNEELFDTIYNIRVKSLEKDILKVLTERGVEGIKLEIHAINDETFLDVEKIIVNLDNAVIKEIEGNKIDVEAIRVVIANTACVPLDVVIVI